MYGLAFFQLDAFSTPKLKKNNENMKTEWVAVCSEIDELRAKYIKIEERFGTARKDHRRALDQLREDRKAVPSVFVFPFVFWLVTAKLNVTQFANTSTNANSVVPKYYIIALYIFLE